MQAVVPYLEAEAASRPFGQIRQGRLGTEPATPDPSQNNCNKKEAESEDQAGQHDEVKFLDPQNLTEQVKVEPGDIDPQQTFAINLQPGKEQKQQRGGPLKQATPRTYEHAKRNFSVVFRGEFQMCFVFHEKTGRE